MTDYKKLALYYLKAGKRRCIVTIVGVMITVAVLYTALNFGYSYVLPDTAGSEERSRL